MIEHIVCTLKRGSFLTCRICIFVLGLGMLPIFLSTGENDTKQPLSLKYLSGQTLFYAEHPYILQWTTDQDIRNNFDSYLFRIHFANRTVLKMRIRPQFPLIVKFQFPKIRSGVIIDALVTVSGSRKNGPWKVLFRQKFSFISKEWLFKPKKGLEKYKIGIIDRTEDGSLIQFLKESFIPFSEIENLNGFAGQWIICAGLDFIQTPSIYSELISLIQKSVSVLVLPPIKGWFEFPSFQKALHFHMGDESLIIDLDKRINLITKMSENESLNYFFKPSVLNNEAGIEVSQEETGFTWLEVNYNKTGLYFCGWNLVQIYQENPGAVLLLLDLFAGDSKWEYLIN